MLELVFSICSQNSGDSSPVDTDYFSIPKGTISKISITNKTPSKIWKKGLRSNSFCCCHCQIFDNKFLFEIIVYRCFDTLLLFTFTPYCLFRFWPSKQISKQITIGEVPPKKGPCMNIVVIIILNISPTATLLSYLFMLLLWIKCNKRLT